MAVTLTRADIVSALEELVDSLAGAGAATTIQVVGGAAVAISFTREDTTRDIDAFFAGNVAVSDAARAIAKRRGWPEDWLNDAAKQFRSHFEGPGDWEDFIVRDGVAVRVACARLLLAMKLNAARGRRDAPDIDVLLDATGITTVDEAVALFEHYYPEEELKSTARAQLTARLR